MRKYFVGMMMALMSTGCMGASESPGSADGAEVNDTDTAQCAGPGESCKHATCCSGACFPMGDNDATCGGAVQCAAEGQACKSLDCCDGTCAPDDEGIARCLPAEARVAP